MLSVLLFVLVIVIGYLCGSVCSAIIVSQIFSLPNPCTEGSRNPGATNVLRLAGKKYAAIVLIGDMLKGLLPVLLAKFLGAGPATLGFTCLAAVIGHMYPVFFDFKGGKGVATALGALMGLHFIMGVVVLTTWILVANFTRYSSLASLISLTLAPLMAVASIGHPDTFPPILLMTALIIYKHRDNISRLIDGTEPKIKRQEHVLEEDAGGVHEDKPIEVFEEIANVMEAEDQPESNNTPSATVYLATDSPAEKTPAKRKTAAKKTVTSEKKAAPQKKAAPAKKAVAEKKVASGKKADSEKKS